MAEVRCPLSTGKTRRNVDDNSVDYIARGYHVSVSNDGVTYSEEDILVIYDSTCVNCTVDGTVTTCLVKVCSLIWQVKRHVSVIVKIIWFRLGFYIVFFSKCLMRQGVLRVFVSLCVLVFVLDISTLFTTFFLWTSLQFILRHILL